MQTKRATEDADGVNNSLKHRRRRWSRQGTDNRCRQNELQKTQTKQITHQGTVDADKVDEVQTADADGAKT